eukprot:11822623-Karenia_brevis.AAC.1
MVLMGTTHSRDCHLKREKDEKPRMKAMSDNDPLRFTVPDLGFTEYARVELHGLSARPEMNGKS